MQSKKQAILIADLGFGDAGKGTLTDFLTRRCAAHTIVRYNGGPQAAHNVVDLSGRHHTFSQFASGLFFPDTKTLLSRFMLINPLNMLKEARHLKTCGISDALQRVQIDRRALVITPFQRALNRLREIARGTNRHGSCGEGVGECMADSLNYGEAALCAGDLGERSTLLRKLHFLRSVKYQEFIEMEHMLPEMESVQRERAIFTDPACLTDCLDAYQYFARQVEIVDEAALHALFAQPGTILFEGAQGVLLDEYFGFAPYTTWSTTTYANAETLLRENDYSGHVIKLGVTRAYTTRHGAGPFPTEDHALTDALPELHNGWNDWQREFRVGHCDLVAMRYARDVLGELDYLAVTHLDRLETLPEWRMCVAYHYQGERTNDLSTYFQHNDRSIRALWVQRPPDLTHQEWLTSLLQSCLPIYQHLTPGVSLAESQASYLSLIEEKLAVPLAIASYGPTARDKTCFQDFEQLL
jgi:adenylosuccinate synthase